MSIESRIEAWGRRVLRSPLWVGLAITAILVVPTFLVPGVALWIGIVSLLTLTPLVLFGTYLAYYLLGRFTGLLDGDEGSHDESREADSPIAVLKHRYAVGEIDEETFERKLDRLLDAGSPPGREGGPRREADLLRE
ncbi:SHOCT domain-containing protein [Natronorarus salvus]|uniref:SHOCT domain-containing protein n=1 Tax=Natronorarus salvus TaxID=3117733 RepID=UPI002F267ABE